MKRPGLLTGLVALAVFCVLIGLGAWQVQRLKWKTDLLRRIDALASAPAVPLGQVLERARRGEHTGFTRVEVRCLQPAPAVRPVWLYALFDGRVGWRQIAPCRISAAGYSMIGVDRGLARDAHEMQPLAAAPEPAPVRLTGVIRDAERPNFIMRQLAQAENDQIGYRSREHAVLALQNQTRLKAAPVVVVVESEDPQQPTLIPAPLPRNIANNHLGYAITWFGLAAALAGVYLAMLLSKRSS